VAKEVLFDDSPVRSVWIAPDESGFTLRTRYKNTQDILDANLRARNDAPKRFRESALGDRVASIPMEVWEQWQLEWFASGHSGTPDDDFIWHKLNSPEFSYFKTREVTL
jgi:hypothetical protein